MVEVRGVMRIEIIEQGEVAPEDQMNTVRLLIFDETSGWPELELNKFFNVADSFAVEVEDASKLGVILDVSKRVGKPNKKRVVAIVNEPQQMKAGLEAVGNYDDLEAMELDFAHFLNNDHTTLQSGKGLPMTGMVETQKVYATVAEDEADGAEIVLERAVARVQLYIRKDSGLTVPLSTQTTITLKNSYDRESFIRHEDPPFGQIQTVPASQLLSKTWNPAAPIPDSAIPDSGEGLLLCSFYTPERTCTASGDADKLGINIKLVLADGSEREAAVIIDKARRENGTKQNIEAIRRNNSYTIIANVEAREITLTLVLLPWHLIEILTEFN